MIINYPKMLIIYKVDFIDKKAKQLKRCKLKEWNNLFTFNIFLHVTENFIEGVGVGVGGTWKDTIVKGHIWKIRRVNYGRKETNK